MLAAAVAGTRLSDAQILSLADLAPPPERSAAAPGASESDSQLAAMLGAARAIKQAGHGARVTYSRKVFIPLTQLCNSSCGYCTFAGPPKPGARAFLTPHECLSIARRGAAAGCKEALFTLGDRPEARWPQVCDPAST